MDVARGIASVAGHSDLRIARREALRSYSSRSQLNSGVRRRGHHLVFNEELAMKKLDVLTVVHYGKYNPDGAVIDDKCPCCNWDPPETLGAKAGSSHAEVEQYVVDPDWHLGEIWAPGVERGIGAYYRVFHCQGCGLVYATHL